MLKDSVNVIPAVLCNEPEVPPKGIPAGMPYVTMDENGQAILHDETALGVMAVVEEHNRSIAGENCRIIYQENLDRVSYFQERLTTTGRSPAEYCMLIADVDDTYGGMLAELTMPGQNWDTYREAGQKPIARGLVGKHWLHNVVEKFDPRVAEQMTFIEDFIVVVVASGIAHVINPDQLQVNAL